MNRFSVFVFAFVFSFNAQCSCGFIAAYSILHVSTNTNTFRIFSQFTSSISLSISWSLTLARANIAVMRRKLPAALCAPRTKRKKQQQTTRNGSSSSPAQNPKGEPCSKKNQRKKNAQWKSFEWQNWSRNNDNGLWLLPFTWMCMCALFSHCMPQMQWLRDAVTYEYEYTVHNEQHWRQRATTSNEQPHLVVRNKRRSILSTMRAKKK